MVEFAEHDLKRTALQIRETGLAPRIGDLEAEQPAPEIKAGFQTGDVQFRHHGREAARGGTSFGRCAVAFLLIHFACPVLLAGHRSCRLAPGGRPVMRFKARLKAAWDV
ncbi:hypothetical protein G6F59_018215 [Rhizopus arrhizus]|nr:hypothetical protein G6F59_018215 [Rhizopus arrhizus]